MSEEGYKLDPSSIKPVLALKDSPPKTVNGVRKLMGFLNYYRRYVKNFSRIAKPIYDLVKMASQPSQEAQQKLYNDFILRFGFPLRIHHDQRGEFENRLHRELEKLCGVEHSRTTPYHPLENGQVE